MALAREGSEAASEEIVRRYRPALVRYAATIVPGDRADDVVQDSLAKALPRLADGESEMHLRSWLYTIVRNTAFNDLRDAPPPHEQIGENHDGVEQPPQALERRQSVRRLVAEMNSLPAAQRQALVKRELEGRGHDEIAAQLGVSAGAARQLVFRARESLRQGLGWLVPMPLLRYLAQGGGDGALATAVAGGGGTVAIKAAVAIVAGSAVVAGGVAVKRAEKPDRPAVAEQVRIAPASTGGDRQGEARGGRGGRRNDQRGEDRSPSGPDGGDQTEDRRVAEHGGEDGLARGGGPGPEDDGHGSRGSQEGDDHSGGSRSGRGGSEGPGSEEHSASSGSGGGSGHGSSSGSSPESGTDSTESGGPGPSSSSSDGSGGSGRSGESGGPNGSGSSHDLGSTEGSGSSGSGGGPEAEAISEPPRDSGGGEGLSGETDQPPQEDE